MTELSQAPSTHLDTFAYDDKIVAKFLVAMMVWGIVGLLAGVYIALQLCGMGATWGPTFLNAEWLSFGRLRPLHTNAVIFAFTGNGIFAGSYYAMQRLLKARMWSDKLSQFNFWGWQAIIVSAALTLPLGITQGKEYAELEWPIDIAIALVWIAYGVNMFGTIFTRRERHLYVAIWFFIATWVGITMLHVVNSLATPVSAFKSYSIYSGVQDALVQWWYGHNAVAFFLTTPILGLMYYYLPKAAGRPVYSYRLSIIHYWSLVFIYIWAGPHHLLHTSLPEWAQTLGVTFSIILWMPSWGGMINGLLTLRGAWDKVRESPVLKFLVVSVTFYGMATFEGPLLSVRELNALSHNTDWTIGHVHSGALGWVGFMMFGMGYWLVPKLYKTEIFSKSVANFHFWIATIGIVLYAVTMWVTGIMQGSMWFAMEDGVLKYTDWMLFLQESMVFYFVRAIGGAMYLVGAILGAWNLYMTARSGTPIQEELVQAPPLRREEAMDQQFDDAINTKGPVGKKVNALHAMVERMPFLFIALTAIALVIGGAMEIIPNMVQGALTPRIASVKPYTPLELIGRDIYIREGCYNCHTQMVRTLRQETLRYGDNQMNIPAYTRAGEHIFDYPFQWGSKRTGPDLAREGVLRPGDAGIIWHYQHTWYPAKTTSGVGDSIFKHSIMPAYKHLYEDEVDFEAVQTNMKILAGAPRFLDKKGWYDADRIANAPDEAKQQAMDIARIIQKGYPTSEGEARRAEGLDWPVTPTDTEALARQEIVALTAYLMRLGTDITKDE